MPVRLIEIVAPEEHQQLLRRIVERLPSARFWKSRTIDDRVIFNAVVHAEDVEAVLDPLQRHIDEDPRFGAVVYPLVAAMPELEQPEPGSRPAWGRRRSRVSRAELSDTLSEYAQVTPVYISMAALSTITAAVGLANDNAAVIIGAMVIAPLLGPNMALSLATTIADLKLARRSLLTSGAGLLCAAAFAAAVSFVLDLPLDGREVLLRVKPSPSDIAVALAAGVAGALAATTGVSMSLVGVMVAVALLPPLVVSVMLLMDGQFGYAGNAALLLALNIVCVNLAGVGAFLVQGVRPFGWEKGKKAKRIALLALSAWIIVLVAVAGAITYISFLRDA